MNRIIAYLKEAYMELRFKVTWPTLSELQNSAVVVLVASVLIAIMILLMDVASRNVMELYYNAI